MSQELGIVLKSFFPYKKKISILTKEHGKIDFVIKTKNHPIFSPGTIVLYDNNNIKLVNVPELTHNSITWIHHIIEICYHFTPINMPCSNIYQFMIYCFDLNNNRSLYELHFNILKRVCRIKLLMLIGFFPDRELSCFGNIFEHVVSTFLDSDNTQKVRSLHILLGQVHKSLINKADCWVLNCLHEHPHIANFRTIQFFDNCEG